MRSWSLLALLATLWVAGCTEAETGIHRFTLVTEGTHAFAEGETVSGDLVVLRGDVHLDAGARVLGGIILVSGNVTLDGTVDGNVTMLNGTLRLGDAAHVGGNVEVTSGVFERAPQARVDGEVTVTEGLGLAGIPVFERPSPVQFAVQASAASALLAALAALVAWSLPRAVARIGHTAARQPAVSGALGILVLIAVPSLLVLMAFTLLLIPVTILGFVLLGAVALYAWIGLGFVIGSGVSRVLRRDLRPVPRAAIGTGLLTLILNVLAIVPLLAAAVGGLALAVGVGAVFLTGFGRRHFIPASEREQASQATR